MIADEMVGWHHRFNGYELGQAPGDSEGQESLCAAAQGVVKNRLAAEQQQIK